MNPVSTGLPEVFSTACLEKNLAALARREPGMVQRISWPADGSHVLFHENGRALYKVNGSTFPLEVDGEQTGFACAPVEDGRDILVFGIGLGEQIDYLLHRFPGKIVTAWEKDPWLLRLFLMRKDYSRPLATGALKLSLGTDLIRHAPLPDTSTPVYHPLLKTIYHNEARLLVTGIGESRVIVNTGGLFVDDAAAAFRTLGYTPFYLNLGAISLEEIEHSLARFMPQILFSINYPNGLAEFAAKWNLTLLCWEIDHVVDAIPPLRESYDKAFIFTYRRKNMEEFLKAGFTRVEFLPMAADTDARKPVALSEEDLETYSTPVSFVGNLLSAQAGKYRKLLFDLYREYCRDHSLAVAQEEDPFEKILRLQGLDYTRYRMPQYFHELLPGFEAYFRRKTATTIDPVKLLAETAAAEKRLRYMERLAGFGVKVWGDEGWKAIHGRSIQYMGPAGHKAELNKIYTASAINVDVNRIYQPDMANMRIFDIMACGGFVLAEFSDDLADLFELGSEIITYRTLDELEEEVRRYLAHPQEARRIAEKGMTAVRERHTVRQRVETMLSMAGRNRAVRRSRRR
jgi:spore maturation protein CgeB